MTEEKLQKAVSYIDAAQTVALICHVNPDGDTVGSALALYGALEKTGKDIGIFCDDKPPEKLGFLQNFDKFNKNELKKFDLAIAVDCSDLARTGEYGKLLKHAKSTLVIDHHKSNQGFTDYQLTDITAAATAEVVFDVIRTLEKGHNITLLDGKTAEALFLAIVTDSGAFGYSNVTDKTHTIAAELYKYDFNPSGVIYDMIASKSKNVFCLTARVLNKARFYLNDNLAIITFTKEDFIATGTASADTEGVISNLINIREVKVAVALTEEYDRYFKVSFRTKEPVDAADCAAVFGGGGHSRAAGCRISGFYEDVIDKLIKVAGDRL